MITVKSNPGRVFVGPKQAVAQPKTQPPQQRARLLAFIQGEVDAGRAFPSNVTMAAFMGWKNSQSVENALLGLSVDGHVRRITKPYRDSCNNPCQRKVWELVP